METSGKTGQLKWSASIAGNPQGGRGQGRSGEQQAGGRAGGGTHAAGHTSLFPCSQRRMAEAAVADQQPEEHPEWYKEPCMLGIGEAAG